MSAVPVHQALFWPGDSPVSPSGEADFGALSEGLGKADYLGVRRGPLRGGPWGRAARAAGGRDRSATRSAAGRMRFAVRQHYSCAQHAVVVSRAVEALAALKKRGRRVLAMHAWLAEVREAELNGEGQRGARKRLALRFMDLEALADVLACTMRWDGRQGRAAGPAQRALDVNRLLVFLARMEAADRNRLARHALFSELFPAGLGTAATEAALRAAGLGRDAPAIWVEILRFVRRMADETVRRDLPRGAGVELTGFPALAAKIEPMAAAAASRLWLERHRALRTAVGATHERRKAVRG